MKRFMVALLLCSVIAGCANNPPPRPKEELVALTPEQFILDFAKKETRSSKPELIETTAVKDQSASYKHLQIHFGVKNAGDDKHEAVAKWMLSHIGAYCAALDGKWTTETRLRPFTGKCQGNRPFQVSLSPYSTLLTTIGRPEYYYWWLIDLFEPTVASPAILEKEYALKPTLVRSNVVSLGLASDKTLEFSAYAKRDPGVEVAQREAAERRFQEFRQEQAQKEAQRIASAQPYIESLRKTGTKICRTFGGIVTYKTRMGFNAASVPTSFIVTAFTEKATTEKIQLRIAGVRSTVVRADSFSWDGNEMKAGAVIWDEPYDWRPC